MSCLVGMHKPWQRCQHKKQRPHLGVPVVASPPEKQRVTEGKWAVWVVFCTLECPFLEIRFILGFSYGKSWRTSGSTPPHRGILPRRKVGSGKRAAQNHTYSVGPSSMHSKEVWPSSTRNTIQYLTLGPVLSLFLFSILTAALAMQTRDRVLTQCELIGLP